MITTNRLEDLFERKKQHSKYKTIHFEDHGSVLTDFSVISLDFQNSISYTQI